MTSGPARPASPAPGRIGILGGTFDPVHLGHLALAEEAREVLGLDRVLFVVAGDPWQKAGRVVVPGQLRLAMVEAAVRGNPAFEASRVELDREGPTFTVDTLETLAARGRAAGAEPDLWFLLSADALAGLRTWRRPDRVLQLARLAVAPRVPDPAAEVTLAEAALAARASGPLPAGWRPATANGAATILERFAADFPGRGQRVTVLDGPRLGISSTAIRARVAAGRSIRYLVPDAVADLIGEYALYQPSPAPIPVPASD
jgi:nicotinate-nucleotide adenylyltransferase